MQDELEDNQKDYCSLTHEYFCESLSTIEVKDNRKVAATQINNISYTISASHSDSDKSIRVPRKEKSRTGLLHNNPNINSPKRHGTQSHCMLCKNSVIPEKKYMLHSSEECFGRRSRQNSVRIGLVVYM